MKKRQIKINFIDYLYYTIGGGVWGVKFILIPFLWVFSLIFVMISPLHIGWGIFLAVVGGLLCYGFSYIYDKRGPAVRQYFDRGMEMADFCGLVRRVGIDSLSSS